MPEIPTAISSLFRHGRAIRRGADGPAPKL